MQHIRGSIVLLGYELLLEDGSNPLLCLYIAQMLSL